MLRRWRTSCGAHMGSGPCPCLMFHGDLSFLWEWEPVWVRTWKTVFEEWSYEEALRCQTSASSITLASELGMYSRARSLNKLAFSREHVSKRVPVWTIKKNNDAKQEKADFFFFLLTLPELVWTELRNCFPLCNWQAFPKYKHFNGCMRQGGLRLLWKPWCFPHDIFFISVLGWKKINSVILVQCVGYRGHKCSDD